MGSVFTTLAQKILLVILVWPFHFPNYKIIGFKPEINIPTYKHLKKSNAACLYAPIVLKLLIVVQMWKQHEEGN